MAGFFILLMADEFIDILNKDGTPTQTTALKSEAHKLGLFHKSVHLWIATPKKELIIQKRAANKDTFPDLWDVSVAGHIGAGEEAQQALIRETKEEIGIVVTKESLRFIGVRCSQKKPTLSIIDNEYQYLYIALLNLEVENCKLQREEVAELKAISIPSFEQKITKGNLTEFVPHGKDYYTLILAHINALFGS
ncbi:NUDIX hydrolase [Aquimarina brevivitae]|uniref:Isopentenyldiphosphate isomerase n=1 Tax=Aquimarina brevivitae TaxID=323412 RepID=A0A4Q7NVT4_9FLAO|nr:NUDIX domain-containing protein [Aquimarina brevivitae]RZS90512.1 isopentenyldiphosphate isomerase [Aquimarina brevivitae]